MRALLLTLALLAACKDDASTQDDTGVPQTDDSDPTSDDSQADDSPADDSSADDSSADDSTADDSSPDDSRADDTSPPADADGDGYSEWDDCDDDDPAVHPDADEVCDGVDNDCDGEIDTRAIDATTTWADHDRDGFGDPGQEYTGCETIEDSATNADDCDDSDAGVNPDADEVCDEALTDEDCDGAADDDDDSVDPSGFGTWYGDNDGDGYGDAASALDACLPPSGYTDNADDCDDSDGGVYTGCDTSWDGSYTGSFSVTVTVTNFGLSDTCSGTGSFTVNTAASTPISGSFTCAFAGLGASLLGAQTITMDGTIPSDPSASGNLSVGSIITDTWTGTFSNPGTLSSTFSGTGTYSSYNLSWSGSFSGSR